MKKEDILSLSLAEIERRWDSFSPEEREIINKEVQKLKDYWEVIVPHYHLRMLEVEFHLDPNPLFIWEAIKVAYEKKISLPPWVMNYLNDCAEKVLALLNLEPHSRGTEVFLKALAFLTEGQGDYVTRYHRNKQRWEAVRRVLELRKEQPISSWEKIFEEVGEEFRRPNGSHISGYTIRNWFKKVEPFLEKSISEILSS